MLTSWMPNLITPHLCPLLIWMLLHCKRLDWKLTQVSLKGGKVVCVINRCGWCGTAGLVDVVRSEFRQASYWLTVCVCVLACWCCISFINISSRVLCPFKVVHLIDSPILLPAGGDCLCLCVHVWVCENVGVKEREGKRERTLLKDK